MNIVLVALLLCTSLNLHQSITINCKYNMYSFWAVGSKYECNFVNNFSIDSPDKVQIEGVKGTHTGGKTNNDEIYIHAISTKINYFPQGLEKIFPNLVGINLHGTNLKGIQQYDLKSYTKLTYLCLYGHDIQFLENDLFDYNLNLEHVLFQMCKIVHIGLNVFDNMNNLVSLFLGSNTCFDKSSKNKDRTDVQRIINELKDQCRDFDFLELDEKINKLVTDSKSLNHQNFPTFKQNLQNYESKLNSSKFSKFSPQKQYFDRLKISKIEDFISISSNISTLKPELSQSESKQCKIVESREDNSTIIHKIDDLRAENVEHFQNLSTSVRGLISERFDEQCSEIGTKFSSINDQIFALDNQNKKQIQEFTPINQKLADLDSKIDQKYSNLNQKLGSIEDQMKNFDQKFSSFDEKFSNLADKLEGQEEILGQNYAQLLQKVEKSIQVTRFNILKTVESKIDKLEKRLEGKVEEILNILRGEK